MSYENILIAHVAGALATAGAGAYALVALWNSWADKYRIIALVLGALASFEILTGTALAVFSLKVSAAAVCERLILYLALVALVEFLLFKRMKKFSLTYPLVQVTSPILGSLGLLLTALAVGF